MIKDIIQLGAPELRQISEKVSRKEEFLVKQIWQDLKDTLDHMKTSYNFSNTVGLSAVQIGYLKRACIVQLSDQSWRYMANPTLSFESNEIVYEYEGCLSFFDKRGLTPRPSSICVQYTNENFDNCEEELEGWDARIVLHEMDHMDGVLYTDRMMEEAELLDYEDYREIKKLNAA